MIVPFSLLATHFLADFVLQNDWMAAAHCTMCRGKERVSSEDDATWGVTAPCPQCQGQHD